MKLALEVCATVEDFKHFLDSIKKPSLTEANFGVIDAKGGAAMFETGYYKYTMYDVNNPKDAPYGYIARTNFSFAGEVNNGAGYVRYMQEDKILMPASATKQITPSWIFKELARSFTNSLLGIDLKSGDFNRPKTSGWFVDQDFIARKSTSCSVVVQGVKVGENAELTTMWTVLGYPPASVVVPVWVKGADFPALVGGVSHHECSFAHVDSNVLHGRSVFSFNDIAYILIPHCKYGFMHLTNYPDSDVKSMGSEHAFRSRRPMRDRTYSIL
jgi:hypothetical protein